jgi:hypothetical protein
MNLFEKYEEYRLRFKPGTIWRDKGSHMVKELEIVSNDNLKIRPYHMSTAHDLTNGNRVTFRIIRSAYSSENTLGKGNYASWDKKYMEHNYEPIF